MLKSGKSLLVYLGLLCVVLIIFQQIYQDSVDYKRRMFLVHFKSEPQVLDTTPSPSLDVGSQRPDPTTGLSVLYKNNSTTTDASPLDASVSTEATTRPTADDASVREREDSYDDMYEQERERLSRSPYIYNEKVEVKRLQNVAQTSLKKIYAFVQQVSVHSFKQCLYSNCAFVDNMAEADAVIFSASSIRDNNMPLGNRTKGQRWIMYTYDPAVKDYGLGRDEVRSHFNMTMSYQLDSDFPLIFGQLKRRKLPEKDYDEIYDNKTNHTAWFVSHCATWGRREEYVERMKKFMDVDIFGGCSDRRCGVIHYRRSDSTLCLPMLTRHYKFYLAFENSFCKDYLTEKFFKLFQDVDVIPVVRGGFDYKKYLPSGIFVNAADFKGPEELAQYLNRLAANKTEYVRMLKRKNRWFERWSTSLVCNVCEALHTTENKTLIIRNLRSRFNGNPSFCWNAKDLGN
ncbi:hypothetical protein Btru_007143 [Bulinus truncatus]|nr:hypothetical protein Btru_007143 [Bulinus truncatus]